MKFKALNPSLVALGTAALAECKLRFGRNGLKIEEGIASDIPWRPTFQLKPSTYKTCAFEVSDVIFPVALKEALESIRQADLIITVYQVCSQHAYQNDPKFERANLLRNSGCGIITIDDADALTIQAPAVPLLQFIPEKEFISKLAGLTQRMSVALRTAFDTYRQNERSGVQNAGQVVEDVVNSIAKQAKTKNWVAAGIEKWNLADKIDELWTSSQLKAFRGELGAARDFVKEYRNATSHAPRSNREAAKQIRHSRAGFLRAVEVVHKLQDLMKAAKLSRTMTL